MAGSSVTGIDQALKDLRAAAEKVEHVTQSGLLRVGYDVLADATANLRPSIVTGNLQNSGFVRNNETKARPNGQPKDGTTIPSNRLPDIAVEVGFTAIYARWVHDYMEGRSPQYLANAVKSYAPKIEGILKDSAKREGLDVE